MWIKIKEPSCILDKEMIMMIPYDRITLRRLKKKYRCKPLVDFPRKRSKKLYTKI